MKPLRSLLRQIVYRCLSGSEEKEITGITYDTRKIQPGNVFVCICGSRMDSHTLAEEAVQKGAAVLVVEKSVAISFHATVLLVQNTREALARMSCAWFDDPADHLCVIGVTGTKGKTTTVYMIHAILQQAGYKAGLMGTVENWIGDEHQESQNTTPESYVLQENFAKMVEAGCQFAVMEVSSQALKDHRCDGFQFAYGVFTNIGIDHIGKGEHKNFTEYLETKKQLLQRCKTGIVNRDDPMFKEIIRGSTCHLRTFGCQKEADFYAENIYLTKQEGRLGVSFRTFGEKNECFTVGMPGRFTVSNALAAISVCSCLGIAIETQKEALCRIQVKGRVEAVSVSEEFLLLIDYAHNAMSLQKLLETLREYHPNRLICVFGCGGNRSRSRRTKMGEISGKIADLTVLTSDNPRDEDPEQIFADILLGLHKTGGKYVKIPDRKEAIRYAIQHAKKGDIIVLAGKGHENYQIRNGKKYPMDERKIIREIREESKGKR